MKKNLFTYRFKKKKTYLAVEYFINKQGKESYGLLILQKTQEELHILHQGQYTSLEELVKAVPPKQGFHFIINSSEILTKKVDGKQNIQKATHKAFPNLNQDDFYIETFPQENNTFISIARKVFVDNLIKKIQSFSLFVISFSLGSLSMESVLGFADTNKLKTNTSYLSLNNQELSSIELKKDNSTENYSMNGLSISSSFLVPFSALLASFFSSNRKRNFEDKNLTLKSYYQQEKLFRKLISFGLASLFSLLLISFLIFNHYYNKVSSLENSNQINLSLKNKLVALKTKTEQKEQLLQDMTASVNSKLSLYLDKIGQGIPATISLEELFYQPILYPIKPNKKIQIDPAKIVIKGTSVNSVNLSSWIKSLEQLEFVTEVTVLDYNTAKHYKKNSFKLHLKVKPW